MRFTALRSVVNAAKNSLFHYPATIFIGVFASIYTCLLIENNTPYSSELTLWAWLLYLSIPLFFSIDLFKNQYHWKPGSSIIAYVIGACLVILLGLSLDYPFSTIEYTTLGVLSASLHLLVAFAPFIFRWNEENAFWNFNATLFQHIVQAAFYSSVLYIGLAVAILLSNPLFDLDIKGDIFVQLFLLIIGVFNTWFFVSRVPSNIKNFNKEAPYPLGLKVFTQFILIPLMSIYMLILFIYAGKILIEWDLPRGWVSYMIIFASIVGILSLLLLHPIRDKADSVWIRVFSKSFYIALLPLIALLFVAIGVRIRDYGFTENRFLVLLIGIWLLGTALYQLLSKEKKIQVIPVSLFVLLILSWWGPWSMFEVSRISQINRFVELTTEAGLLNSNQKIQSKDVASSEEKDDMKKQIEEAGWRKLESELSSVLSYLEGRDFRGLQHYFDLTQDEWGDVTPEWMMREMGLQYVGRYSFRSDPGEDEISDAKFFYAQESNFEYEHDLFFYLDGHIYEKELVSSGFESSTPIKNISFQAKDNSLKIDFKTGHDKLISLQSFVDDLYHSRTGSAHYGLDREEMTVRAEDEDWNYLVRASTVEFDKELDGVVFHGIYFRLFMIRKN